MTRTTIRGSARSAHAKASVPAMLGGALLSAALLAALVVGGWQYREYRVNRSAEIRRNGFEFQESIRDALVDQADDLAAIDAQLADPNTTQAQADALTAQRSAMATQLCSLAADLNGDLSPIHNRIIETEC